MVGWHNECHHHESNSMHMSSSEIGETDGQGGLVCRSPWDPEESDMTEQVNHNISRD